MNDTNDLSVNVNACAELVQAGDADRFLSAMTGSPDERAVLFPLYAFNLEIARAPFMSNEPMVGLVRLQFWRDVVEGKTTAAHDVAAPVVDLIARGQLSAPHLLMMIDARESDIEGIGRQSAEAVSEYARGTSGAMMMASKGAADEKEALALSDLGTASGLANWLLSQPDLARAGRGHIMPSDEMIAVLADEGLRLLTNARENLPRKGTAAMRSAWRAKSVLTRAKTHPDLVRDGGLGGADFARKGRLVWLGLTGGW